jgi:hypothetical protein
MFDIKAQWRTKDLRRHLDHLKAPRLNQALSKSVNDTAKQVEKIAERIVASRLSLEARRVRKGIYIRPASTPKTLTATIRGSTSEVPLKVFRAKEMPGGTVATIWGAKQFHPDAFIKGGIFGKKRVDIGMGGHVFVRKSASRLPIKKAKGASIGEAMNEGAVSVAIERNADKMLAANVLRQLDRYTRKARGKF